MQKSSHSVADLRYRILLLTKGALLQGDTGVFVRSECERLIRHLNGAFLGAELGDNYICLLVSLPPKLSVSEAVNVLKGVSARLARKGRGEQGGSGRFAFWLPYYYAATAEAATAEELLAAAKIRKEGNEDGVDGISY